MNKLHLEIPLSIFAAGCIICLLAGLTLFSPSTAQSMYITGLSIGLIGIVIGLIVFSRYKMAGTHRNDD